MNSADDQFFLGSFLEDSLLKGGQLACTIFVFDSVCITGNVLACCIPMNLCKVRRSLRELYEKLSKNREKYAAGGDSEDIASIIKEANDVLRDVKGTQEAMEDAKMFKLLCQTVLKH